MTRQTRCTGLPGNTSSSEQATRRTSDGRTVGAPNSCRDLRGAATCGSVLPHTGGRAPSGHATRGGAPAAARHTTQGTSAGPVDTGKPAGLVTRRWVSRWGLPGGSVVSRTGDGSSPCRYQAPAKTPVPPPSQSSPAPARELASIRDRGRGQLRGPAPKRRKHPAPGSRGQRSTPATTARARRRRCRRRTPPVRR